MPRPAKRIKPILFIPGALFWALFGTGLATGNGTLLGLSAAMMVAIAGFLVSMAIRASAKKRAANRRVWTDGQPARARIVSISTTGGSLNDHPYVDLELDVQLDGGAAYRAAVRALISILAVPRIQPACEIAVHVDRSDRSLVVVDPALTPYGYGA